MLWYARSDGSDRRQLTFAPIETDFPPGFSPDGSAIAFTAHNPGSYWQVEVIPVDGGDPQPVTQGNMDSEEPAWSPSGDAIAYGPSAVDAGGSNTALHIANLRSHRVTEVPGSKGLYSVRWSPDGHWLLALTPKGAELMLYDFSRQSWQTLVKASDPRVTGSDAVATHGLESPEWSGDGRCVFFTVPAGPKVLVERVCLADRKLTIVADMASGANLVWSMISGNGIGVGPDGSFYASRDVSTEEIYALDVKFP
jgi:Tol biopolymer transport system component